MQSSLCFWHPVGPHSGESLAQIQTRKIRDVTTYGFTTWAFAPATALRVYSWRAELKRAALETTTVFCCGNNTTDPLSEDAEPRWMTEYSEDLLNWRPLPHPRMSSYHRGPTKSGFVASAFYVTAIEAPEETRVKRPESWYRTNGLAWERSVVPTRGEYLVRRPSEHKDGTRVRLMLSVQYPYVVWLR